MLQVIYTFFLGLLLALFVGIGVSVFYDAPEYPEPPDSMKFGTTETLTDAQQQEQEAYNTEVEKYDTADNDYSRNVSIVLIVAAILMLVVGVGLSHKLDILSDGILLGGVFTLIYAIGRGLSSDDEIFRFVVVTVGLVVALGLGWWKFVRPTTPKSA